MNQRKQETVYVVPRQLYLHDRVAPVSNRVGEVKNGEKLQVVGHDRRFLKVKKANGVAGWIEEHGVIDSDEYAQFQKLADEHKNDPVVATAVLRDDIYAHVSPGRKTQRFYLLPGNAKVKLLVRASVPKEPLPAPRPISHTETKPGSANAGRPEEPPSPPPVMEDWWLVRDDAGDVGWILANRVDVDVPNSVAQYAEGQRIVAAYVLTTVHDENSDAPNHEVPEYVMLLEPYKSGLPFDFDQVRVFTWSRSHHHYETAFRLRPIAGFLPAKVDQVQSPMKNGGMVPGFSIKIAADENVAIDPNTGIAKPAATRTLNFAMIDTVVKRIGPDLAPIPSAHLPGERKKEHREKKGRRRR